MVEIDKKERKLIKPVPGYDWKNYDKKRGIDISGHDVPSQLLIEQVVDLIMDGYSDSHIYSVICRTYGMNSYSAQFIIKKAHTEILKSEETQEENMLKKQNFRLFKLYRKAMEENDNRTALQILSEINKLNKLYVNKIEISNDVFTLDLGLGGEDNDNKEQTD